jgi:hypothetical protein
VGFKIGNQMLNICTACDIEGKLNQCQEVITLSVETCDANIFMLLSWSSNTCKRIQSSKMGSSHSFYD